MAKKTLIVEITGDTGRFSAAMKESNAALMAGQRAAERATAGYTALANQMSALGNRLTLGVSLPILGLATAAVQSDMRIQGLRLALETTTGSAAEASRQFARLIEVAKLPGIGFEEAVRGSIALQGAGFSAAMAERSIRAFANALASVGGGKAELEAVNRQLMQMVGKGKPMMEDIRIIRSYVPQISKAMREIWGTTDTEAIQKMGVTGAQFVEQIVGWLEKLRKVQGGVKNDFENLSDASNRALAKIGEAMRPATQEMLRSLTPVVAKVEELAGGFQNLPRPIQYTTAALVGATAAIGPLLSGLSQIGFAAIALRTGFHGLRTATTASSGALAVLGTGLRAIPWAAAIAGATGLMYALSKLPDPNKTNNIARYVGEIAAQYKTSADTLAEMAKIPRDVNRSLNEALQQIWTATQPGAGATVFPAPTPDQIKAAQDYQEKLDRARDSLGMVDERAKKMHEALGVLNSGFRSGKVPLEDYTEALTRYWQAMAGKAGTGETLVIRAWAEEAQAGLGRVTEAIRKTYEAGLPWGRQLELIPERFDAITSSIQQAIPPLVEYQLQIGRNAKAVEELAVSWEQAGRGTTIPMMLDPESTVRLKANARILQEQAMEMRDLWQAGKATQEDYQRAQERANDAEREANLGTERHVRTMRQQVSLMRELGNETRSVFRGVSADIANLIRYGGKFKDVLNSIPRELAAGFARVAMDRIFDGLIKQAGKLLSIIGDALKGMGGIAGALGKILGAGGDVLSGGASAAGGAVSGTGGAGTSAASAATGGPWGAALIGGGLALNAIAGLITGARAESTANATEWNTRKSSLHLESILSQANSYLPKLADIHWWLVNRADPLMWSMNQSLMGGPKAATAGAGITISITGGTFVGTGGVDAVADQLVRRLKLRGA